MCPKEKLFKGYVQLERDLGEIDRCRKVYRRVLVFCCFMTCVCLAVCRFLEGLPVVCPQADLLPPNTSRGKAGVASSSSLLASFLCAVLSHQYSVCTGWRGLPIMVVVDLHPIFSSYLFFVALCLPAFCSFSKCLEAFPSDCGVWAQFAALEGSVGETERSRAVFELAIRQPVLDMPETLWKAYIDFEVGMRVGLWSYWENFLFIAWTFVVGRCLAAASPLSRPTVVQIYSREGRGVCGRGSGGRQEGRGAEVPASSRCDTTRPTTDVL